MGEMERGTAGGWSIDIPNGTWRWHAWLGSRIASGDAADRATAEERARGALTGFETEERLSHG